MKSEERIYVNIILSLIIVFCAVLTVFLVVKRREIERRETYSVMNSTAALPFIDYEEKVDYTISLSSVISGYQFNNNYDFKIEYKDMIFNFKCTNYYSNTCMAGSAYFVYNNITYELFDYVGNSNNFLVHPYDLLIIKNGSKIGIVKDNNLSLFNEDGSFFKNVENIIIRYREGELNFDKKYPHYIGDELEFYSCENNLVKYNRINALTNEMIESSNISNTYCITV